MAIRLGNNSTNSARKVSTTALATSVDAGTTNPSARLMIYTGTQPATPETTATGTLLVTIPFASTAFAAVDSSAQATLAGTTAISATAVAAGTAGWFRVVDRDNHPMIDGSVGLTSADMIFDNVTFTNGGNIVVNTFNIVTPM